jgi:hypothetical protein
MKAGRRVIFGGARAARLGRAAGPDYTLNKKLSYVRNGPRPAFRLPRSVIDAGKGGGQRAAVSRGDGAGPNPAGGYRL